MCVCGRVMNFWELQYLNGAGVSLWGWSEGGGSKDHLTGHTGCVTVDRLLDHSVPHGLDEKEKTNSCLLTAVELLNSADIQSPADENEELTESSGYGDRAPTGLSSTPNTESQIITSCHQAIDHDHSIHQDQSGPTGTRVHRCV